MKIENCKSCLEVYLKSYLKGYFMIFDQVHKSLKQIIVLLSNASQLMTSRLSLLMRCIETRKKPTVIRVGNF